MIFFAYILLFLILVLLAIALVLSFVIIVESLIKRHDLPTSRRATRALADIIKKYKPDAKIFYDLGSAHGTLSLRIKKLLPHLEIYAIDNSAVRISFAKLKSRILKRKIYFKKQDIFKTDLHNADLVYAYLWYDLMPILKKKLQKELRQGTVIITNTSHFKNWQPTEKIITYHKVSKTCDFETLFVYIKK